MIKKSIFFPALVLALLLLGGCAGSGQADTNSTPGSQAPSAGAESAPSNTSQATDTPTAADSADMFTDRDYADEYEQTAAHITLGGSTAESDSANVQISGSIVTITGEGTYIFSGELDDGMIVINAKNTDKLQLVLDGAAINSETSAAIYVLQADKVFITLAPDSVNALSNGGTFTAIDENNIDAVIFSKDDLTLNGSGQLTITSPAGHGIVSKDDLVVTGGAYHITAAAHGLSGKDSVRIAGGDFSITAGKDGIHGENADNAALGFVYILGGNFSITADGDGISASGSLEIESGAFTVLTGGGSASVSLSAGGQWSWNRPGSPAATGTEADTVSTKGIKATGTMLLGGGTFSLDCADDALHTNASLTISGGSYTLSSGDDGIHADAAVSISGGEIRIARSYEGIEGLSIDISGGSISLFSSDDGLNAAGGSDQSGMGGFRGNDSFSASSDSYIAISGGMLYINASGDGIDSNGSLRISGGETYVSGPVDNDNGALDYTTEAVISGGVLIAAGSSGMAQNFSSTATQGSMLVSTDTQPQGASAVLADSAGSILLSWTADKAFDCILISCPELTLGTSYTLSINGADFTVTMSSLIYGTGGMGYMGGGMGHAGMPGGKGDMGSGMRP